MTTPFLVNHLWQSSCFALLAGLLAFVLRKNSAKVRYLVWLGASLKFLMPFALLVSLGNLVPRPAVHPVAVAAPVFPSTLVEMAEPLSQTSHPPVPGHASLNWMPVAIGVIWALGFLAIALTRCRSWLGVRAALQAGTPVELPVRIRALITPGAEEPGIVGFLRPVLVLPAQLLENLNHQELEAILAHELCHVRRCDNLFAAVHMVGEAIFWFHPLVWWIGARMVEERELACDEEVLRMGFEPADYVEGILKVCRLYLASPLPCVSGVTGASVKKRLRAILAGKIGHELNGAKKMILATTGLAVLAMPVLIGIVRAPAIRAQSAPVQQKTSFEVASVKISSAGQRAAFGGGPGTSSPGQYYFNAARPDVLIMDAYDIEDYQIVSKSNLARDRFDVVAKVPAGATREQFRMMLQNLLAERFHLKLHHETRELAGWELVVAKSGLKIKESQPGPAPENTGKRSIGKDGFPILPEGPGFAALYSIMDGFPSGHIVAQQQPISVLARQRFASKDAPPIADHTGLTGVYDFRLAFSVGSPGTDADGVKAPPLPDLFTAVREQLGLQFIPKKMPFDILVIDSFDTKPVEN